MGLISIFPETPGPALVESHVGGRLPGKSSFRIPARLGLFTAMLAVCAWTLTHIERSNLPRVLLIGDSISIGYTPFVQKFLRDEAIVIRPMINETEAENCAGTNNGILHIKGWLDLGKGHWDVIHFNFGLHDLKRVHPVSGHNSSDPRHPRQADPDRYAEQLEAIVMTLKTTGAMLIFATTTPVSAAGVAPEPADASPHSLVKPHRDVSDPPLYNDIARKIMERHEVAINDLFAFAEPRLEEIQLPRDVHFTLEGSRQLAEAVVSHLRQAIRQHRGKKGTQ